MKTDIQKSAELNQLCELIKDIDVAMLTNRDTDGALVSRPMTPLEMDSTGALWFFTDLQSAKGDYLHVANLSFTDPGRATYVSVSGRAQVHSDPVHVKRLWTPLAKPWFPEGPDSPNLALLKFEPQMAEYWDSPHSKMVRMFAMAASVLAGKPIGLGEHEILRDLSKRQP